MKNMFYVIRISIKGVSEIAKINKDEYEVLKGLGSIWKWIARDGSLCVYFGKPNKHTEYWEDEELIFKKIDKKLFQFIQWEDEEPYNIQDLIEEYENSLIKSTPWTPNPLDFESEETEVKKNIEWLKEKVQKRIDKLPRTYSGTYIEGSRDAYDLTLQDINELDELEVEQLDKRIRELESYNDELIRDNNQLRNEMDNQEILSQEENVNIVLDDLKEYIKEQQTLSQNVGMAHTPAGNDTYYRQYDYVLECINEYEPSDDLQNLLVPKQEEVDRAYKDGYEKGKEHASEKQTEETETVAKVLVDYLIASAKLKLVLSMEVEELEE